MVFYHNVTLKVSEENLQERIAAQWEPLLRDIFVLSANINDSSTECVLFLCSYAVALFRCINHDGHVYYFLLDSHSRNSRGITDDQQATPF